MTQVIPVRVFQRLDGTFVVKVYGGTIEIDDNVSLLTVIGGGQITAVNNAVANRLVSIGATVTELDAEANLTFDGTTLSLTGTFSLPGSTSGTFSMDVPATITDYTITWPSAVGAAGTALVDTLGDGNLAWTATSGMGTITALNNQAENRLVTIGATTTELDGEANLTFDGTTLNLTGQLTVSGTLTFNSNTMQFGNAGTDVMSFNARANTDFSPIANNTHDLGTVTLRWQTVFVTTIGDPAVDLVINTNAFIANGEGLLVGGSTQQLIGGITPELQVLGTGTPDATMAVGLWSATNTVGSEFSFLKSANGTIGSFTIVADNEIIGVTNYIADDGVDYGTIIATMTVEVDDASPAAGDIGAAYVWSQMPGGGGAIRETMRLGADGILLLPTAAAGLVVGHSAILSVGFGTTPFQVLGTGSTSGRISIGMWTTSSGVPPVLALMKSANATIGSNTIVGNGETLGIISFFGDDGTDFNTQVCDIQAQVNDASPATGAIGGRFLIRTATVSGTMTTAITINADQTVDFADNVQIAGALDITGVVTISGALTPNVDSTSNLGTTTGPLRFLNLFVDSIGDTGNPLGIECGANNLNITASTVAITGACTVSTNLTVSGTANFNGQIRHANPALVNLDVNNVDAQNDTLLAADIVGGLTIHTSVTGAGTVTIDTATNIVSGVPINANGLTAYMYYINDGTETLTFAVSTGLTISDTGNTLAPDSSCILLFRRTDATNVVMHIIGST